MKLSEIVAWLDDYLDIENYPDASLNGLQLDAGTDVERIAVAVDSNLGTLEQAVALNAQLLIVHHGMFWGAPKAITGAHGDKVRYMLNNGLSLYAAHIPLDAHREVGNNWGFAGMIGLEELEDFGEYKGRPIGVKGRLKPPMKRRELAQMIEAQLGEPVMVLEGGPDTVDTLGIISGGAAWDVVTAAEQGLDAFLTGEPKHEVFYEAFERRINAMYGGHYMTETVGVNLLGRKVEDELGVPFNFIYVPTGL